MIKISTFYKKDELDLSRVTDVMDPENAWVLTDSIATRKFDGTSTAIINGELYKRYDVKQGRTVPEGAIACQEPDMITGHWPHWVPCNRFNKEDRWHFEAFDCLENKEDGTYELCGPKVQKNPEQFAEHKLIRHGSEIVEVTDYSYKGLKELLSKLNIEGIVFHNIKDGRMCKIRKTDFGIKRN